MFLYLTLKRRLRKCTQAVVKKCLNRKFRDVIYSVDRIQITIQSGIPAIHVRNKVISGKDCSFNFMWKKNSHLPCQKRELKTICMFQKREVITACTMLVLGIGMMFSTGCSKDDVNSGTTTYDLKSKDVLGVNGGVTFVQTSPTVTTINITLTGAPAGTHPAGLYSNSVIEGGTAKLMLKPVDESGKSSTTVSDISYSELVAFDGSVKVLKSDAELGTVLAQGDIGGNVLTNTSKTYNLATQGTFGVSGTALFQKRVNGNTLVTISLTGMIAGDLYPATINLGSVTTMGGGPIVATLANVDPITGKSYTNIKALNSDMAIRYNDWMAYDGYINIYQSSVLTGAVISHGNIGSN